jgi:nitroreductase
MAPRPPRFLDAGITGNNCQMATREPLDVLQAISSTRAIRRYRPDRIPEADLATMCFAASRAPSGSNRQLFRFLVLADSPRSLEAKALLGRSFREGWVAKRAEDMYTEGSGAVQDSPKARQAATMQHFVDHFEETPVVFLACLIRHRAETGTEGASVYPAVQNLLLAGRALGYGGVITMWHFAVDRELRELLAIPDEATISATIPMGRPVGSHGPVRRRPLREFVYTDSWNNSPDWAIDPPGTLHAEPKR